WDNGGVNKTGDELMIGFSAGEHAPSEMTISKEANVASYVAGDLIDYTLTINNPDTYTHTDVTVTDILPEGLSFVSGSASASIGNDHLPPFSNTKTYTSGTGSFVVPEGVTEITVETWGAGGA